MKKSLFLCIVGLLLIAANLFAANGDMIVNGKLGVGTSTPSATLDVVGGASSMNLVKNGGFSLGVNTNWVLWVNTGSSASMAADTNAYIFPPQSAHITVNSSPNMSDVQLDGGLTDAPGVLITNRYYTLSFWAKAATPVSRTAAVILNGSPYTNYGVLSAALTSTWQKFSVSFLCAR